MGLSRAIVRGASAAALTAVLLYPGSTRAQTPAASNDKVAAEALFEDGRRLAAAGNFAEACPKFADSQRLNPSAGTLLNLASCYEKVGRTATAWATYREAASVANAMGRSDYVATAQRHAEALAPHLARLTVSVVQPAEGQLVMRDGVRVDAGEWGVPIPVDPGSHAISATAPGHKGWTSSVDVASSDGAQASVSVPALEALPVEAPPPPAVVAPPPVQVAPPPPPAPSDASNGGSGQRTIGLIVAGAGVVGLGLGTAFAVSAKSQYNSSLVNCEPNNPNACNGTGVSQRDSARTAGDVASIAVGVGAAALVGGAILWITAPRGAAQSSTAARVGIAPTLGGALVQGAW